jgi:hypothetical protein
MKLKHLLLISFLFSLSAAAQDMIITQYGDTLNKKIIFSTKRYLFYADSNNYGKHFVRGIKKSRIQESQMNEYKVDRYTMMMNERARDVMGNPYMVEGGVQVSYTPFIPDSNATSSEKKFYKSLSVGISYNISFHLRLRPHSFIGIVIDDNRSRAFAEKLDIMNDDGTIAHLENITASLRMFYVGPEFTLFIDSRKYKSFFVLSGGIGYAHVKWSVSALNRPAEVYDPAGIGIRISAAKTWAVSRSFILGPNVKIVNAIAGSKDLGIVMIPRINIGLTVLVH